MTRITIDMTRPFPPYLKNWADTYIPGNFTSYVDAARIFHETTGGHMIGRKGYTEFDLVFVKEEDLTFFLLRFS